MWLRDKGILRIKAAVHGRQAARMRGTGMLEQHAENTVHPVFYAGASQDWKEGELFF